MTGILEKVEFVITTQQQAVIRSGRPVMADNRTAKAQMADLMTLARKLKMTKAVAWLQPRVLEISD